MQNQGWPRSENLFSQQKRSSASSINHLFTEKSVTEELDPTAFGYVTDDVWPILLKDRYQMNTPCIAAAQNVQLFRPVKLVSFQNIEYSFRIYKNWQFTKMPSTVIIWAA